MPCICGDTYCPSCGPAQGNSRCCSCGMWQADGGCEDLVWCELEANAICASEAIEFDCDADPYHPNPDYQREAKDWCAVADAWRLLKSTIALNEWPIEIEEEV